MLNANPCIPVGTSFGISSFFRTPRVTAGVAYAVAQFFATFSGRKSYSPPLSASIATVESR